MRGQVGRLTVTFKPGNEDHVKAYDAILNRDTDKWPTAADYVASAVLTMEKPEKEPLATHDAIKGLVQAAADTFWAAFLTLTQDLIVKTPSGRFGLILDATGAFHYKHGPEDCLVWHGDKGHIFHVDHPEIIRHREDFKSFGQFFTRNDWPALPFTWNTDHNGIPAVDLGGGWILQEDFRHPITLKAKLPKGYTLEPDGRLRVLGQGPNKIA